MKRGVAWAVAALALCVAQAVLAGSAGVQAPAARYFTDTPLLDQAGRSHRFYSDLIEGHTVLIHSFFAHCQSVCPPVNERMAKLQEHLGDRLGNDVRILSITTDPARDDVASLRNYAKRSRAKPGWYFLTGNPEDVNAILGKLGQATEAPEGHSNILLVGNARTGLWKKAFPLASLEDLVRVVDSVANDR